MQALTGETEIWIPEGFNTWVPPKVTPSEHEAITDHITAN